MRPPSTVGYIKSLRYVWRIAEGIVAMGLEPLLDVWPSEKEDADVDVPPPANVPGSTREGYGTVSAYPAGRREFQRSYGPLLPRPLLPKIWNVPDSELRRLWPNIPPDDIREYAPWAVTRSEVERLVIPAGRPIEGVNLEAYVKAAIRAERERRPREGLHRVRIIKPRRAPGAFRIKHLQVPGNPLPVIFGPDGRPIGPPPIHATVTRQTIRQSLDWVELGFKSVVTEENLSPILNRHGTSIARHSQRQIEKVLGINLRANIPGLQDLIDQWRTENVNLIETGLWADRMEPKLRPGLLGDVSRVVENAHAQGRRVEYLAGELQERFDVDISRAELIARDQTLKLNAQVNQHRQRAVGVRQYRWGTSRDERTRERHLELHGSLQSWDQPPEVGRGRHEHPGGDYQCRCIAIPVAPDWLEEQ